MSYVVHIWENPRPASLAEAARTAFEQGADRIGQNPGFLILAGRLTARYPCITTLPDDEGVWSDGPLDGQTEERVWALGIRTQLAAVLPFLVAQASKLGLTVFDMQAGKAYLPSGEVLQEGAASAPASGEALTIGEVRDALFAGLQRLLGDYGFEHERSGEQALSLDFPGGWFRICVPIAEHKPSYRFSLLVSIRLDAAADISSAFRDIKSDQRALEPCAVVHYGYFADSLQEEFEIQARHDIGVALIAMSQVILETMLPVLQEAGEVHGLDRLMNANPSPHKFNRFDDGGYSELVLGRLADNPEFAQLRESIIGKLPASRQRDRLALRRLAAYLEKYDAAHPAPLPACRFDDLAGFADDYDGTQQEHVAFRWNGESGQQFNDANRQFRWDLVKACAPTLDRFSLGLLRDVFVAEASAATIEKRFDSFYVAGPAQGLLTRGGVGELQIFADSIALSALETDAFKAMTIPAAMAESLGYACNERTSNPMFSESRQKYAALAQFFTTIGQRRQ